MVQTVYQAPVPASRTVPVRHDFDGLSGEYMPDVRLLRTEHRAADFQQVMEPGVIITDVEAETLGSGVITLLGIDRKLIKFSIQASELGMLFLQLTCQTYTIRSGESDFLVATLRFNAIA